MDPVIRIAAVTTLFISTLLFVISSKNWRWSVCISLLMLSMAAFVIDNGTSQTLRASALLSMATYIFIRFLVGFLWLFLLCTFEEEFRFKPIYLFIFSLWTVVSWFGQGHVVTAFAFGLVMHGLWIIFKGFSGDMRTARRQARVWMGVTISAAILIDIAVDVFLGFRWRGSFYVMSQNLLAGLVSLFLILLLWRADLSDWIGTSAQKAEGVPIKTQNAKADLIVKTMRENELFLQPNLRFEDFAQHLPFSQVEIRRQINHELGFGHFTSFVNQFRIEHAKSLLRDPQRSHEKIIAIAFDSGFASLPSFQRVFKSSVGTSPSEWKKSG